MKPADIEKESFRIIETLTNHENAVGKGYFTTDDWHVARRMIHACGDIDIVNTIRISRGAVAAGEATLAAGTPVICDVRMAAAGLSQAVKGICPVHCFINEPEITRAALNTGETRARAAMKHAARLYPDAIYLIGNAPTALLALLELVEAGKMNPALVVGIPVGFVMAAESKDLLVNTGLKYVTNLGYKGGTPMAVAAVNAIIKGTGAA